MKFYAILLAFSFGVTSASDVASQALSNAQGPATEVAKVSKTFLQSTKDSLSNAVVYVQDSKAGKFVVENKKGLAIGAAVVVASYVAYKIYKSYHQDKNKKSKRN